MDPIYIVSGVRTAVGDFGGALKDFEPSALSALVFAEAIRRASIEPALVEHCVLGQVVPTQPKDCYTVRVAAVTAGIPVSAPAFQVNRLCGSGLQAIVSAAQMLQLGEAEITVAGGVEVMTRSVHMVSAARFGQKLGDFTAKDGMLGALQDPFEDYHMGVTAENVAARCNISREDQDALALLSHQRAARAQAEGRFKDQILPIEIKDRKGSRIFDTDEHVRAETTMESLGALRPAFKKDGTVTAGNSSGINDGAAAVILATRAAVDARGLKPMAKIAGWGHGGVEPSLMGLGPVAAVPVALKRAGLSLADMDVIESNEAFAVQAAGVAKELGFDPEKTNPNGSGVSLGHPIGATGAILTVKAMYELHRTGGRYGLITMCIGGGQGIAMVIERV